MLCSACTAAILMAFASDFGIRSWVHGHLHSSFDYRVHGSQVVANPRGYPHNRGEVNAIGTLRFENESFDPMLVIEVESTRSFASNSGTLRTEVP